MVVFRMSDFISSSRGTDPVNSNPPGSITLLRGAGQGGVYPAAILLIALEQVISEHPIVT